MIDINSIIRLPGETEDSHIDRIFESVDTNWIELSSKAPDENPYDHYMRYCLYKEENWMTLHMLQHRAAINETDSELTVRVNEVRRTANEIEKKAVEYIFNLVTTKRNDENFGEHYYRILSFEISPMVSFILKKRDYESDESNRNRFISYCNKRDEIIVAFEQMINYELERADTETLQEWKDRYEGKSDQYEDFIYTPRIDFKTKNIESLKDVEKRIQSWSDGLAEINAMINNEETEKALNDECNIAAKKERAKLEAKIQHDNDVFKESNKDLKEVDDFKWSIHIIVAAIVLIVAVLIHLVGWFHISSFVVTTIATVIALTIYKKKAKSKIYNRDEDGEYTSYGSFRTFVSGFCSFFRGVEECTNKIGLTDFRKKE